MNLYQNHALATLLQTADDYLTINEGSLGPSEERDIREAISLLEPLIDKECAQ